jgi:hypothetical protein
MPARAARSVIALVLRPRESTEIFDAPLGYHCGLSNFSTGAATLRLAVLPARLQVEKIWDQHRLAL